METEPSIESNKITYNKLVRDRIPEIIEQDGATCETKTLKDDEFIPALSQKMVEESTELTQAKDRDEQIKELADVSEIMNYLMTELKISPEEIESLRQQRKEQRGGFDKKIFLISTEGGKYSK